MAPEKQCKEIGHGHIVLFIHPFKVFKFKYIYVFRNRYTFLSIFMHCQIFKYNKCNIYIVCYTLVLSLFILFHLYIYMHIYIKYICIYIEREKEIDICVHLFMSNIKKKSIIERNFVLVALKYFNST